jgi:palmitoyltransferase ZDHHC6
LQREQISQKVEKRARTRRYKIIKKVSGSWMPLLSQGFKVCIHPPLTDESRIPLEVGDLVNVTRWRPHWLFGEKIQDEPVKNGKKNHGNAENLQAKKRIRGWFPRQCAVDFFVDNDVSDAEEEERKDNKNKKKK